MAWWTRGKPTVTCLTCLPAPREQAPQTADTLGPAGSNVPPDQAPAALLSASDLRSESDPDIDLGTAGRSAMGEYQRRHGNREERIRKRWGRLADFVLALSEDPQSTRAWKRGSIGESKVAKTLAGLDRDDIVVLHDRNVPGTRRNIDHLVICPAGILVVDSKRYEGQVHTKDVGGLFVRRDLRLFVGRRDCTRLAEAMGWQVAAVKGAIDGNPTPVRPVLCFIDADWPLLGGPREFQGVLIESDRSLRRRATEAGELDSEGVRQLAMVLAHRLPASA
jgi:Nuclease-related domain